MAKDWIGKMHMKRGALREELHVPKGKKIPKGKLAKAVHSKDPTLAKRAKLAETLSKFRK